MACLVKLHYAAVKLHPTISEHMKRAVGYRSTILLLMWHFVSTAMCWWNWTGSDREVHEAPCAGLQNKAFFNFKIRKCSWDFRLSQRCCWRFTFYGIWRRLVWLAVTDVSNDRSFFIHRIEQSKIQLGYFFDCWSLNVKVLLCVERSEAAIPSTQHNISEALNAQQ